ncbi:type I secretion system permease/ATPase [Flaviflagellibacter deserti]|uniref:Type I secretion system permease/ATPase n=1 Tax=Flaviflagellibacter deserti TaxID=2267266 RepID=A0ABV9YZ31_9HYPH
MAEPLDRPDHLRAALGAFKSAFVAIAVFSGFINLLLLTGSFFMLLVYDRVLPSRSLPTLFGLLIFAAVLYGFQAGLDMIRSRVLARISMGMDEFVGMRIVGTLLAAPPGATSGDGMGALRDLDQVRGFMASIGPAALLDLPWMPLYILICFLFHPLIGITALVGALILIGLTVLTDTASRAPSQASARSATARNRIAEAGRRNAEALQAMGMVDTVASMWSVANQAFLNDQRKLSDVTGFYGSISKAVRMLLQSAILAVGAYLVVNQNATGGIMIAGSILMARALAPVELAISQWRSFVAARQSWKRLQGLLNAIPEASEPVELPAPKNWLRVENLSVVPPGAASFAVRDASFQLRAGNALGIIGPTASGKSSLARALVGVWAPARGSIRLDGATLDQFAPSILGRHVGYLPQDVELLDGTIAENICRFDPQAKAIDVIAAAKAAGVHDLIVHLPGGYQTVIGESGASLSGGQRQRIGLARALYRDPFLVVLDEPNSNLDTAGEEALTQAILDARTRGAIVVVIAHRPSALIGVDMILFMQDGHGGPFGPKEEVLPKILKPTPVPLRPAGAA